MHVALICVTDPLSGGAATYERAAVARLMRLRSDELRISVWLPGKAASIMPSDDVEAYVYRDWLGSRILMWLRSSLPGFYILRAMGKRYGTLERTLAQQHVDLALFLSPNPVAIDFVDMPMISTVWDLGHREIPEFPELSGTRHFEERDLFYTRILPRSVHVFTESEILSDRLCRIYGLDPHRLTAVGLLASLLEDDGAAVQEPSPPGRFLLYPAHFWPHKRHVLALEALRQFHRHHPEHQDVRLVLTGGDKGNLDHVRSAATAMGLMKSVEFKGFVSDSELARLVRTATALLFPSALGNMNLPQLEAALVGTPVITDADKRFEPAIPEDLLYAVEGDDPDDWSDGIRRAVEYRESGRTPAPFSIPDDFAEIVLTVVERFRRIRKEWPGVVASDTADTGVVVPTLGLRPDYLLECVASIRKAGAGQILVVRPQGIDLGSEIRSMIDVEVDDPGTGLAAAINAGIGSLPDGVRFATWLGDDDRLTSRSLELARRALTNQGAVASFGQCQYIDANGRSIWLNKSGRWVVPLMSVGPQLLPQPGSLFDRAVFEQIGGLDESLKWAFDLDLFLRLRRRGRLEFVNAPLAEFRWHQGSLSVGSRSGSVNEASLVRRRHLPRLLRHVSGLWEPLLRSIILDAGIRMTKKFGETPSADQTTS